MSSLKQPPIFDPDGGDSYNDWKADVEVWKLFTKEEKKRQGPAVYLCLQGDAREVVRSITLDDLAKDDGVSTIIKELDKVYLKDETTRAFCAFRAFVEFRRESGMDFTKFLVEFNNRYREVRKYKMELGDGVLAYFLLVAANLSTEHERLVRATAKLTFEDVKEKLQKVFGEFGDKEGEMNTGMLPVKEECLYSRGFQRGGRRGGFSQRGNSSSFRGADSRGRGKGRGYKSNPMSSDGTVMRCHECESTKHFVSECPHRKVENANMTIHLTLVAGAGGSEQDRNLVDTLGRGILDSGCTKTVAGSDWMDEYLLMLSDCERIEAEKTCKMSNSMYRFGDGQETKSIKEITIPVFICDKRIKVPVDVVNNNIPLLIGRPTMSSIGMLIDTSKHEVNVGGKTFKLSFNSAGHYIIPISEWTHESCQVVLHLEQLSNASKEEKKKKAKKLHRQFAHAPKERLIRLLKDGGCDDEEMLSQIERCCDECSFCQKYRKVKPRPIVGLPKADRFNEVVFMDLKEVEKGKIWILHLVDAFARYTAASLINTKKTEVVVCRIFQIWLAYFGAPKKFHNDCGGEFVSAVFMEMNEKMGIETSTTPAEAPYSNGVVERNNAMLYETMMKTKEDTNCSMETALAWAVCAKNSLQNSFGYSPNQLVFGRNVNLPSVDHDNLPALSNSTSSQLVRENLEALHRARENFVKAESSERIRRALRKNIRTYSEVEFVPGEKIYYKRKMDKDWRGPGKVLGKESNFVLIRHGAAYYRCHPCQLLKVNPEVKQMSSDVTDTEKKQSSDATGPEMPKKLARKRIQFQELAKDDDTSDEEDVMPEVEEIPDDVETIVEEVPEVVTIQDDTVIPDVDTVEEEEIPEIPVNAAVIPDANTVEEEEIPEAAEAAVNPDANTVEEEEIPEAAADAADTEIPDVENTRIKEEIPEDDAPMSVRNDGPLMGSDMKPKNDSKIQYAMQSGEIYKARVLSTQPKKKGKWKSWLNVQVVGETVASSVCWDDVLWWRVLDNDSNQILVLSEVEEYRQDIVDAKHKELLNLEGNNVFEVIEDVGQKAISSRWVIEEKMKDDKKIVKARLVARGFEEVLVDKRVDSPTCSREALRLILVTSSTMDWEVHSLDISSAFLQGNQLERHVVVRPPKDICEKGKLWKLNRCLYGLSDAPREWYNKVKEKLEELKGKASLYDQSMFLWHENDELCGILVIHVDDFIYGGIPTWHERVIGSLMKEFKISRMKKCAFRYLGLNLQQSGDSILVDQFLYIDNLKEISIDSLRKKQVNDKLTEGERKELRSMCGQLLWVSSQTRPDVSFETCSVSNYGREATVESLIDANRAVRKLKATQMKLVFPDLGDPDAIRILTYGDATHASLPSGESQGANIVFVCGNNRVAPISWKSKKLERVTKSPLASEVSAIADSGDYAHLVASMVNEIFQLKKMPKIELRTDSKSLIENMESTRVIQDPRLRVDVARLKQMVKLGEIDVTWVPGELQLADSLTKKGASADQLIKVLVNGAL